MSQWTKAATEELERYFKQLQPTLKASGADAAEVIEDLRRHVQQETETAGLPVVTAEDVRRLLTRIGAPEPAAGNSAELPGQEKPSSSQEPPPPSPAEPARSAASGPNRHKRPSVFLLVFGVAIPAITLVLELFTGMCAQTFFDPLPGLWQVVLVALVPAANLAAWVAAANRQDKWRTTLGWLNGAAMGVAGFYTLLFVPLLLPGIIGVLFWGIGLLPWAPLMGLVSAMFLRQHLRRLGPKGNAISLPGLWRGLALGLGVLLLGQMPVWVTRVGLHMATSERPDEQRLGLRWMRTWHHEETLRRACYGRSMGAANFDLVNWVVGGGRVVSPDKAREVYYRITGRPFNVLPPPEVRTARGRFLELDDWSWDADQGGEQVGGRIKGLTLVSSRLDTLVDANAAYSYCEWMLEFKNSSPQQREARAQVLLPPDGVVSRLTLWVNGEEREAAFAGRGQTREAYQKVAIRQRRDPVLVTTAGPDRVLMQCFPVPPDGGTMRVRVGITAPLALETAGEGVYFWPRFLERNFTIPENLRHSAWLETGTAQKLAAAPVLRLESPKPGTNTARGQLAETDLEYGSAVRVHRDPAMRAAYALDDRGTPAGIVEQVIREAKPQPLSALVVAVDGSVAMEPHLSALADALAKLPADLELVVLLGADEVLNFSAGDRGGAVARADALVRLAKWSAKGGRDNAPLLVAACDQALSRRGAVLWMHAAQPVLLSSVDALRQFYERGKGGVPIYDLQLDGGPNRILEKLDGINVVTTLPYQGELAASLQPFFARLAGKTPLVQLDRTRKPGAQSPENPGTYKTGLNLARLWASEEIQRLQGGRTLKEAVALAARYRLVTPVSGAVVLETDQQYRDTGLEPGDPTLVPSIPEPHTWALLAAALALVAFRRYRRQN